MQVRHFDFVVFPEERNGHRIFGGQRFVRGQNVICYPFAATGLGYAEEVRANKVTAANRVASGTARAEHRGAFAAD